MAILSVLFEVPEKIIKGLATGEYFRDGGVIRMAAGKKEIVVWLRSNVENASELLNDPMARKVLDQIDGAANLAQANLIISGANLVLSTLTLAQMEKRFGQVFDRLSQIDGKLVEVVAGLKVVREYLAANGRAKLVGAIAQAGSAARRGEMAPMIQAIGGVREAEELAFSQLETCTRVFEGDVVWAFKHPKEFLALLELLLTCVHASVRLHLAVDGREKAQEHAMNAARRIDNLFHVLRRELKEPMFTLRHAELAPLWAELASDWPKIRQIRTSVELELSLLQHMPERDLSELLTPQPQRAALEILVLQGA